MFLFNTVQHSESDFGHFTWYLSRVETLLKKENYLYHLCPVNVPNFPCYYEYSDAPGKCFLFIYLSYLNGNLTLSLNI